MKYNKELEQHFEQQTKQEVEANTTQTLPTKAGPSKLSQADWVRPQKGKESLWMSSEFTGWEWRSTNQELFILLALEWHPQSVNVNCIFQLFFLQKNTGTNFQIKGLITVLKTRLLLIYHQQKSTNLFWLWLHMTENKCIPLQATFTHAKFSVSDVIQTLACGYWRFEWWKHS